MKKYILFLICLLVATATIASGDKVKNPWQRVDADQCAEWQIEGKESCIQDPSDQSGSTYICSVLVICPDGTSPDTKDD